MIVWEDENSSIADLVQAVEYPLNPGIPDFDGNLKAYIYVDDILVSVVNNILRLLAAIVEAIFIVCNHPNIKVRLCLLSLEKWGELVSSWLGPNCFGTHC
jgi:hypothetical protein